MIRSKPFAKITAADAIVRSAYQMGKTPLLPLYAASLGAGDAYLGFIVSISTLTGMLTKPFFGVLSDRATSADSERTKCNGGNILGTLKVGNAEIVALTDMNCVYPTPLKELWPNVPLEAWDSFRDRFPDTFESDHMRIEIGCYLVRSGGTTILIDTGYGPGPIDYIGGLRGQLMTDLSSKKVDPEDVDIVFLSHLHIDHVGWNTVNKGGDWVPTFPNARYVVHGNDLEHFRKPEVQASARYSYMEHYIEPLVDSGVFDSVGDEADLTSEVKAFLTPGHTPGHMSVMVSSQGQKALIQGDVLIHPAQVTEVEWTPLFDGEPGLAIRTRVKLLDELEKEGTPVVSCHFPAPGFGRVSRENGRRYWQVGL